MTDDYLKKLQERLPKRVHTVLKIKVVIPNIYFQVNSTNSFLDLHISMCVSIHMLIKGSKRLATHKETRDFTI